MSTMHAQQGGKRLKVRERVDNVDYFQGVDKVEYNNMASTTDTMTYRYYNSTERVHSRSMEEWMKLSVSLTEFRGFVSSHKRQWDDGTESLDNYKRCLKAFYDFCTKLGIKYWTAFDTDLVPRVDSWEEGRAQWEDVTEYVQELTQRYHVKPLWIAPDLHSHPRYTHGALTSPDATTFTNAASTIKRCLEMSQKLACECFLIWPYREGYDAIFQSDVQRELKLFAKLLKITTDYKERLNYRCQMLIMPYDYQNSDYNILIDYRHFGIGEISRNYGQNVQTRVNKYMWDLTSCLYMLKSYNLDRHYKVCTPPGHHMYMANVYNMLGGVVITSDMNHYDNKTFTLMMKCIVDQGVIPPGGIHLKLSMPECELRELVTGHVKYIDRVARALRVASGIVTQQMFAKHLQQRYASYYSGFGSRLVSSDVTMEECEEYCKKNQSHEESSKTEHFDVVFQRYLDSFDHV